MSGSEVSARLTAPALVTAVDLDRRPDEFRLPVSPKGVPYRSLMAIGLVDGSPVGSRVLTLDPRGQTSFDAVASAFNGSGSAEGVGRRQAVVTPSTPMQSDTSVIVCTCGDHLDTLWDCLDALLDQDLPPAEIIVVNNRPATLDLEAGLPERFGAEPRIRIVDEPVAGLSRARNAGMAAAHGRFIAILDDDVLPDRRWLRAGRARFETAPDIACVTGQILPREFETPAQVLFERFAGFSKGFESQLYRLQEAPSGDPLFPFTPGRFGSGANAFFRRDALDALDGFDVTLGAGTHAAGGEDVDIYLRVVLSGAALAYEPAAVVWHRHPAEPAGVHRRVFLYGVGLGAMITKQLLRGSARREMLRRIPRGLVYLIHPGSGKNVRKGSDFPAWLSALELVGFLWGPVAYLRSARASRGHECAETSPESSDFSPRWCGSLDLEAPSTLPARATMASGEPFPRGRVLLKRGADPLGFVDVPLTDGRLDAGAVLEAARRDPDIADRVAGGPAQTRIADRPSQSVSVIVCTRERPAELTRCLRALRELSYPALEVIIVDNAPTSDRVQRAFEAIVGDDKRFRHVVEPRPGLSCARNRGVAAATGDIIAFTDDDVLVDGGWLAGLLTGFERHPDVGCVTGLVASASLETRAEQYFDARVWWSSSCRQRLYLPARGPEDSVMHPFSAGLFGTGANMAFRRRALSRAGRFDERLGAGSPTAGGEDLDAFVRVLRSGYAISYEPSALVWHEHRSDDAALRRQMHSYGKGLGAYITKYLLAPSTLPAVLWRIPRALWHLVVLSRRARSAASAATLSREVQVAELRGLIAGPGAYLRALFTNRF